MVALLCAKRNYKFLFAQLSHGDRSAVSTRVQDSRQQGDAPAAGRQTIAHGDEQDARTPQG
jgi:hypothetical protein